MAYHQDWSQSYMKDYQLTFEEHHLNNEWFNKMLSMLKPDGTIIDSEILDHARMYKPGQNFYKVLAESALRAIQLCQPLRVPSTGYERWKDLQLNFDAREMLEG